MRTHLGKSSLWIHLHVFNPLAWFTGPQAAKWKLRPILASPKTASTIFLWFWCIRAHRRKDIWVWAWGREESTLRDRYREIQRVICPSPRLWEPGIIVCMTGRQPPLGVIYMRPPLLAISTQGTEESAASQPASQPDNDESSQDSPVTLPWKAREIMCQRLYVELWGVDVWATRARVYDTNNAYLCCGYAWGGGADVAWR